MLAFNGNKVACIKILKSIKCEPLYENLGPVVQSIVSLTTSQRCYFVKYMPTILSDPLCFFVEKM